MRVPNAGGIGKNRVFNRSKSLRLRRLTAENTCQAATVARINDGPLAVSSIMSVVVEVCLLQLRRTSASHARCAIVEPIATMCVVQNYAGSRIKSGSYRKCFSGITRHLFTLLVYNS